MVDLLDQEEETAKPEPYIQEYAQPKEARQPAPNSAKQMQINIGRVYATTYEEDSGALLIFCRTYDGEYRTVKITSFDPQLGDVIGKSKNDIVIDI